MTIRRLTPFALVLPLAALLAGGLPRPAAAQQPDGYLDTFFTIDKNETGEQAIRFLQGIVDSGELDGMLGQPG